MWLDISHMTFTQKMTAQSAGVVEDTDPIYPTPPLGQDMTQGQFLSGV